jgi:TPR repeat protein
VVRILVLAILLLGGAGPALAGTEAGIEAYNRGDYVAARTAWEPLASGGDAQAQYFLGHLYAKGEGVARDPARALHWFRAAAEQGEPYGQFALGHVYEHGLGVAPDLRAAVRWYRAAADQGNQAARNNLGLMFEQGRGVTRDYVRAYAWYTRAAEGPGLDPDRATLNQARLAAMLTPEERAAARRLLAEWGL